MIEDKSISAVVNGRIVKDILGKLKRLPRFEKLQFAYFYGSFIQNELCKISDVDICLYYDFQREDCLHNLYFRVRGAFSDKYDIQFFQLLPPYVQKEVIEGHLFYIKDKTLLQEIVWKVNEECEGFESSYERYFKKIWPKEGDLVTERILERLKDAEDAVKLIERNLPVSRDEYKEMKKLLKGGISRYLERAIENVMDICVRLLEREGIKIPPKEEEVLEKLMSSNLLKEETVGTIKKLKGLHSFLTTQYYGLDEKLLLKDIKRGVRELSLVLRGFRTFMGT